jgi:exonuclease III
MRLLSWNIMSGRGVSVVSQVDAIASLDPDIIALQEITAGIAPAFRSELLKKGYYSIIDSFQNVKYHTPLKSRSYGELLASRWPLISFPIKFDIPSPEKVLSCYLICPWGDIQVHTAHVQQTTGKEFKKIQTLEGIYKALAIESKYPRILCGDFNTPQEETTEGQIVTWGQKRKRSGEILTEKYWGQRWDRGERNILLGLSKFDLHDVFRQLHGYGKKEYSWFEKADGKRIGRRYDHVFASRSLNPVQCAYLHEFRKCGLSDHSPLEVLFEPCIAGQKNDQRCLQSGPQ